jgi:hypothetical protein
VAEEQLDGGNTGAPLPAAGDVPDGDLNRAFRVAPFHQLPEPPQAVVVTQLEDRVDSVPGLGLQCGQGFQFLAAHRWRFFEDHVGTDPQAECRVLGMQVVRRADHEIVGLLPGWLRKSSNRVPSVKNLASGK